MALTIKFTIGGVSNKIPEQLIAITDYKTFVVCRPKIDKLSMTFDLPKKEDGKGVLDTLQKAAKPGSSLVELKAAGRYKSRFGFTVWDEESRVLIEAAPKGEVKQPPFFRLEFNPDKLGSDGVALLRELLFTEDRWSYVVEHSRVTRLDIAVDIIGVETSNLLIDLVGKFAEPGKRVVYVGTSGSVETIYPRLGTQVKAYDKRQQLIDEQKTKLYGGVPLSRVEVQAKPGKPLSQLQGLKNPLTAIMVRNASRPVMPPESQSAWSFFLSSCQLRGCGRALQLIADETRRDEYAKALIDADQRVWDTEAIWKRWTGVLTSSGLLNGAEQADPKNAA